MDTPTTLLDNSRITIISEVNGIIFFSFFILDRGGVAPCEDLPYTLIAIISYIFNSVFTQYIF